MAFDDFTPSSPRNEGDKVTGRQDFTAAPIVSNAITPMIIRISDVVKIARIASSYFSGRATMMPAFVL